MTRQIYFAGDAFVVNDRKIGYKRLNDGEEILVESLENDDMKKIFRAIQIQKYIAKIHKSFFKQDPTEDKIENLAK